MLLSVHSDDPVNVCLTFLSRRRLSAAMAATERSYKSRFKNRVADPNLKVGETFPCNIRLSSEFLSNTFITRKTRLLSDGAHGEIGNLWKHDITDSLVIC